MASSNPNPNQQQQNQVDMKSVFFRPQSPNPNSQPQQQMLTSSSPNPNSIPVSQQQPYPASSYPPPNALSYAPHNQYIPYQNYPYPPPIHDLSANLRPNPYSAPTFQDSANLRQNFYPGNQDVANVRPNHPYPAPDPSNLRQNQNQVFPQQHGARLMALLSPTPSQIASSDSMLTSPTPSMTSSEYAIPTVPSAPPSNIVVGPGPGPVAAAMRGMSSNKMARGRVLVGENVSYDVDVRIVGEVQPQLEVSPITKYLSDPGLVVGRQIAVNKTYICYGLKLGDIRVLNINTALRSLLKGHHGARVSDMAFFAEDVHLLASASVDGKVHVWKLNEGPDEEAKPQITEKVVVAVQIVGEFESVHPRICWHSHKQEVLVVGISNYVLKIDTTKVGKGENYSAVEHLKCPIDKLIDGIQLVGKHDGEVTDLSMCQWMTSRLVSSSSDGSVKIWEDRKKSPVAVLRPYDGRPVNSATFLTAPHRPDHIVLITGGPLSRELKVWVSTSEEGWLLPSDAVSWQCIQTLELKSSKQSRVEDAFFNQVVALPRAGLILLANAKKNAIYAVHMEYGPYPAATRMDYIAEFTVTMPILSLTGTSDCLIDGEYAIQVYCVQTQAIQQYALDLSQCLPPLVSSSGLEKTDSTVSQTVDTPTSDESDAFEASKVNAPTKNAPISRYPITSGTSDVSSFLLSANSNLDTKQSVLPPPTTTGTNCTDSLSPPSPMSPKLARMLSALESPSIEPTSPLSDNGVEHLAFDYSVDRRVDVVLTNKPDLPNAPVLFQNPTHLITPSEILWTAVSSSDISQAIQVIEGESKTENKLTNNDLVEKVDVQDTVGGETGPSVQDDIDSRREPLSVPGIKEKIFCSQASNLSVEMARECGAFTSEDLSFEEPRQVDNAVGKEIGQPSKFGQENFQNTIRSFAEIVSQPPTTSAVSESYPPEAKGNKSIGGNPILPFASSLSKSPFDSTDTSNNEPENVSSIFPGDNTFPQMLVAMQEIVHNEALATRTEMNQIATVIATTVSKEVAKELKRSEQAIGRAMERAIKSNSDALWARLQEENAKRDKLERERAQQLTSLITNCVNKDFPAMLDRSFKKEVATVGQSVARLVTPALEKAVSSAISESFQRGVADKTVNQLEKSVTTKLEATVARHIQTQFQTTGKQALQDALKSSFEASAIPAIEASCKTMFDQVNSTFHKGLVEHAAATQRQIESSPSQLVLALRDTISSASSLSQSLAGGLADEHRKLLALAAAGVNASAGNPLAKQLSNGPLGGLPELVEMPLDPTKELSRLLAETKFEEAFMSALQRSDVNLVSWLCSQVDMNALLTKVPLPLSQGVLLALVQQLSCDLINDTDRKVSWIRDAALAINVVDPNISAHVRPIFESVLNRLTQLLSVPSSSSNPTNTVSIRLLVHVFHSMLTSCK